MRQAVFLDWMSPKTHGDGAAAAGAIGGALVVITNAIPQEL
jgi:hypothetical protein